jgi:hypothetical protein
MEHETLTIRRDRLLAASALVPADRRAVFWATLVVGPEGIALDASESPSSSTELVDDDAAGPTSFPLTTDQARELKQKVDEATWAVIKATVSNAKDDVGTIEWSEIKRLTGVSNWAQFAKGRMGGLHRSLRKIAGVPKHAVLLWEGEGWVEDGMGDYSTGTVGIDGPAIHTLRTVCGIRGSD